MNIVTQRLVEDFAIFMLTHPLKIELPDQVIPGPPILNRIPHRHIIRPLFFS